MPTIDLMSKWKQQASYWLTLRLLIVPLLLIRLRIRTDCLLLKHLAKGNMRHTIDLRMRGIVDNQGE